MPDTPVVGQNMKAYRNTGTVALPVWVEVAEIGDLSVDGLSRVMAEFARRGNGYKKNLAGAFNSFSISLRMHFFPGDTQYEAIQANFFAGTAEEWAFMDGAIATSLAQGLRCPLFVSEFPWDQSLDEVSGHDVVLTLAYMIDNSVEVEPNWYTVP
jgi:hypothetical protein